MIRENHSAKYLVSVASVTTKTMIEENRAV